jgi:hypothetical protein
MPASKLGRGAGQPGPIAAEQLIAADVPSVTIQRDASGAEGLDVAVNRPDRDLQLFGQQQQEQGQQAAGAHAPSIARSADSR